MLRKAVCAVAVLAISLGFAMADEIKGRITKIDGNKVTVTSKDGGEKTYDLATDVKVYRQGKDGEKKEVATGTKDLKIGEKGSGAMITTQGNKVTQIILFGGKKKGAGDGK